MCVVSMVGDHYTDRWNQFNTNYSFLDMITRAEFDRLKAEVEEMKRALIAAKLIDQVTGQPDCEKPEKVALLKKMAEALGVDLEDVFE